LGIEAGSDRFPIRAVVAALVVSVALRARFINTPLSSDEGGYMAVARAWAAGKHLYGEAWVDRPQGLVLLFRIWDALTGGSTIAIRILAIIFGCMVVVGVAYVVFAIAGARAAAVAALLVAVASANARIEGFIANGELLAGGLAALGVAAACAYLFRGRGLAWLFAAGVLGGCAISLKQSGFDGYLAVMVCIVVGGVTRERPWRQVVRECTVYAAGLASVLAALVVHGAVLGFSLWWYAIAGYRLGGINASSRADWHQFRVTSVIAAPTIVPLAVLAAVGLVVWLARSRRLTRSNVLVPAWICFASLAFVTGGLFHRHYWVTLTIPLAAAAAVAMRKIPGRLLIAGALAVSIPSFISTAQVIVLDRNEVAVVADGDPRSPINEHVADWYRQHRTPGSTLYVMCASAALYALADAIPPYRYLWYDGVLHGKGAQDELVGLFAGDNAPTFVAMYQDARACNPSGRVDALLKERYTRAAVVDGVSILMRNASG
jgi:hypothetical protein